jgi:hypothetical protein
MSEVGGEEHDEDLRIVMLPSGGSFNVYKREVQYFQERSKKYLKDNLFTNSSDLATLDQVLMLELLVWRWTNWVSQQKDYWGEPVPESQYARSIKETSAEGRQLKAALGIDKVTRDKQRGEDSVAMYLQRLRERAKEFGVTREKQLDKALELFNQLKALMTLHDNCTPDEQKEMGCTTPEVLEWIRNPCITDYDEIDAYFRQHQQRAWIREI